MGNCLCIEQLLSDSPHRGILTSTIKQPVIIDSWVDAWDIVKDEEMSRLTMKIH